MIIVTGATGRLGGKVVAELLDLVPPHQVGASVRDVAAAEHLRKQGVRVRRGDFTEPASLAHALEGAEAVLVVSAAIRGPGAGDANRAAIRAAVAAGASRVLYTSHQAASASSLFPAQHQHAATEAFLSEQPVEHTALRHGFYASTFEIFVPQALARGELRLPADGPVSWTDHDDLAAVDALALARAGALTGVTAPLAAPELLDFADVARLLSELTGRRISRVVVDDEEWKAAAVAGGLPEPAADFTLGMFRAARRGEFAVTDPTLEDLLGRAPVPARAVLERLVRAPSA